MSLTALPSPAVQGEPVTYTATVVSGDLGCTKGQFTFAVDGVAKPPVNGTGMATFIDTSLDPGLHTINALFEPVDGANCTGDKTLTSVRIDPALTVDLTNSAGPAINPGAAFNYFALTQLAEGSPMLPGPFAMTFELPTGLSASGVPSGVG
jgi:hypothetical protein